MTGGGAPGLRERNRSEVRARLIEAALAAFAASGFEGTTIDAIAAGAGVSRRTYFRYFPTKEDVVLARRVEQLERFRAMLSEAGRSGRGFAAVRSAFEALSVEYVGQRRRVLAERALFASAPSLLARDLELDRGFEEAIATALGAGGEDAALARRARFCAAAVVAVVRVALDEWASSRGKVDLVALGNEALDRVRGLAPRGP